MTENDRLTRLEERLAYLQRHVAEQDKAMLDLADEIARLRAELALWRGRSNAQTDAAPVSPDERPPHY